jgi:hypothetical protein
MKTIHKFPLEAIAFQEIHMPYNAQILTVQLQGHVATLWAEVIPDMAVAEKRPIEIYGTGHAMNPDYEHAYIGTFQTSGGNVFHVFERGARV